MDDKNSLQQVYNECDREVAMYMKKQIMTDVCLCKTYGQSFLFSKRCPACQEINTPTKPRKKQASPEKYMFVYRMPADNTQGTSNDPNPKSNIAKQFSTGSNQVHRKVKPTVIPAHEFLNRYYLPCLMATDSVISQMAVHVPKSLAKYFKEEDNLSTAMKQLNVCDNVK